MSFDKQDSSLITFFYPFLFKILLFLQSKKTKASYLVMGRYSTLTLMDKVGIKYGTDAVPSYGDGAFKFNFPLKKGGQLSLWGMAGRSSIDIRCVLNLDPNVKANRPLILFGSVRVYQVDYTRLKTSVLYFMKLILLSDR